MLKQLNESIFVMNQSGGTKNLQDILFLSTKFAVFFEFLYGAMLEDPNEIFYQREPTDEIKRLFRHYEYHVPEDVESHCEKIKKVEDEYDYMIAVTSQGMWSSSIVSQIFKTATYAIYYYFKEAECRYQAKFFMFLLKEDALHRMLKLPQLGIMKRKIQKALNPICLDKKIDIPISKVDELTVENVDEQIVPKMIEDDVDMPFLYEQSTLDENEYVRMRLISNHDWGTMNWSTGKPIDEQGEPAYVDGIVVYVHGGGYICGSSASSRPVAYHYANTTGYPVFSIDYRLAPGYKYPTPLSDCWQAYLWLTKYCEKYLKLKFGKIVLVGDSAGGNLILGITSLSIQKGCRIPDGVHPIYPSLVTAHVHFSPSLLLALDDPVLNSSFCSFALNCYVTPELTVKNHYLMSPLKLPNRIL